MTKFIILFFFFFTIYFNENTLPQYSWPVQANKIITGSFGEFRYFHFHLGQDISTDAKNGLPILAITNARVYKIQNFRYSIGNAIILKHEDGFYSRYGHLTDFSEKVWSAIKDKTILEKRKRRIDFEYILTNEEQVYFAKEEIIAYSGETGIGPSHLHLEIFKDNIYYNPVDFGINHHAQGDIKIFSVDLVPENNKSFINGQNKILNLRFTKNAENKWNLTPKQNIKIKGEISVSISGNESSGPSNKIGFQKIILKLNQKEIQEINFHKISFLHSYRSNFVLDNYKSNMSGKPFKYFTHYREGNTLLGTKYQTDKAGIINSASLNNSENEIEIDLFGISKNKHTVSIQVEEDKNEYPDAIEKKTNVVSDNFTTLISEDKFAEVFFPAYSIFTKEFFKIEKISSPRISDSKLNLESNIYSVSPDYREFNMGYDLYLKTEKTIDPEKFGLYQVYSNGRVKFLSNAFINISEKFFRLRLKNSGNFAIISDNSKPILKIYRYKKNHVFHNSDFKLYLIATDSGTGIYESSLQILVDNEEVYQDLNPETGLRELFFPEKLKSKGKHLLSGIVRDRAGNISEPLHFEYEVK